MSKAKRESYKAPDPPWTPETAAKLQPCQIGLLLASGFLSKAHTQAAYDILKGFRTVSAAGWKTEMIGQKGGRGNGEWSPAAARLVGLLQEWWVEMHRYGLDPGFVYDLIEDGAKIPVGARIFLRRSLDLYVKLQGFRLERAEAVV